jgi:hypothetical protein
MQNTFDLHKWKTYQMFLNESDDDFTFTDTDTDLANRLNKELKVGSIITPDMWDKEALKRAIDYFIAADSPDLANRYKELTKKSHKISGLFNSDIVPGDGYYKIVFTNGTSIHSSNLESEFNVFESLQENDDFEFTNLDIDLAADLDVVELTIGDTITPDMWTDVFKEDETLKKYQIKSLKSSPHKITNIEVIGDDRVLMFGEINDYYYTNEFLKPEYRVVLPDDVDELNEAWSDERKKQDPEGYAKYLEKAKQNNKRYLEKIKQDPEAYAKYLEKANQYYKKNPEKLKQAAKQYYEKNPEKVKQRTNQYNKQHREKLKQAAKQYKEKNPEKVKQRTNQYAKQHREKLKQDPEAYAKYLEKAKQYREKNPEYFKQFNKQYREKNPEYFKQYYKKNPEKAKQAVKQYIEKIKQDPEAYAKHLDYQKQYREKNLEKVKQANKQYREKAKQDYDSYVKQSSDFFYNTITNNPSPELKNIKDNPKLLTKLYSEFIKKAKQQYKSKNKDFSFMVTESDDFEFTDTDKSLAASMYADQVVSKYDIIIDIHQDVDVRLKKPLTDDFILKLLKRPLSLESTSVECTISVSSRMSLISLLEYLNISEDIYSQWVTSNLKLNTEMAEENLNDLVDETISTHVHGLWDDNFEEGNFQIYDVFIDYSEMPNDVLQLAKSNTFREALNKSVIKQMMSPSFYSEGQENVFADYVHYDWNIRVVPNTLNELDDDFTFTSVDKDLASSLSDEVILEPGYVFTGDEIKDDKALKARLIGKTITRYYTRKSPLLNSRDQIMMDIKDVSGKEIQYVLSKLKPNYFVPDEVYDLKLGEEYK